MSFINSNEQIIQKINEVLHNKKDAVVNIVNDKLTISMYRQSLSFHRQATMQIRFFILELVHLHLLQVLE